MLRELSQRFTLSPDDGFLAGLLHDIGMLAVLKLMHEYQQIHGRSVSRAIFEHVASEWHEHIGLRLSEAWNLPDPLPELIGNHHRPPAEDDPAAGSASAAPARGCGLRDARLRSVRAL